MAKQKLNERSRIATWARLDTLTTAKTTLTAALTKVSVSKGLDDDLVSYDQVAKASESQGRRDPTKILTIATSHVEYATENRHYAHVDCPGHARLCEEHDHRGGADDGAIPGLCRAADGPMPRRAKHILLARQVGVRLSLCFLNRGCGRRSGILDLVELKARTALEVTVPGRQGAGDPRAAVKALQRREGASLRMRRSCGSTRRWTLVPLPERPTTSRS